MLFGQSEVQHFFYIIYIETNIFGGQFFLKFPKRHGAIVTICNNVNARSPLVNIPSINKILIQPYSIPSIVYNPAEQSQNVGANLCLCPENNRS